MSLWGLLPARCREAVAGDLEEIWHRGGVTRWTWWYIAVASVAACWLDEIRWRGDGEPSRRQTQRGDRFMQTLAQDLLYGARLMRRSKGFTAAAVLTLGLGIGVNAATFSIVEILSIKPLHYRDPSRVAFILGTNAARQQRGMNLPLADAMDIGRQMQSFERVAAYQYWSANLTSGPLPERVQAYKVTANTFALLGVEAPIGRTINEDDGRPEAPNVIVLSDGLWRRRFGADPAAIGSTVTIDGTAHTIVGVMPRPFEFPVFNFKGEAWIAMKGTPDALARRAGTPSIVAIARLAGGTTYQRAQAEITTVMKRLEADHPDTNRGLGAELVEMRRLGDVFQPAPMSLIALSAVAVVLLLACANVANLLLARAAARERELAVRAALGAGSARLVRQLLTESALLAAAGSVLGLALAFWGLRLLRGSLPELLVVTQPNVLELGIDRLTLVFTLVVAGICALLFGGIPAVKAAGARTSESLKSGGHGAGGSPHRRLRAALMIAEVALSLVLLVSAGLLVRTFGQLQKVDPGFNPDRVLTLTVTLPEYRYKEGDAQRRFFVAATDSVSRVPGVRTAGFVNVLPFSTYGRSTRYVVDEATVPEPGREPATDYRIMTERYFAALEIAILEGRSFDSRDRESTDRVAIINRTLARRAFGGTSPIGRRLRVGRAASRTPWLTIVGVAGDVRHSEIAGRPEPELYVPVSQTPTDMMMLAAKTTGNPEDLADAIQRAIAAVDPLQPVYHVKPMRRLVDEALLPQASAMSMMTIFAMLAFLLATVGIYGVISYVVSQQTREFGVRLALGASPSDLVRLVLRRGLTLLAAGTALGAVGAIGATRLLRGILYGVTATDWPTYVTVGAVLFFVGAVACYIPARRATRLDPAVVLRAD
jgi:putative ABC transport system permease protein